MWDKFYARNLIWKRSGISADKCSAQEGETPGALDRPPCRKVLAAKPKAELQLWEWNKSVGGGAGRPDLNSEQRSMMAHFISCRLSPNGLPHRPNQFAPIPFANVDNKDDCCLDVMGESFVTRPPQQVTVSPQAVRIA